MNFYKSLAVAGGISGAVLGAVVLTGLMTNDQVSVNGAPGGLPQTLRIQTIPVRLGGYGLISKGDAGEIVLLSIALRVDSPQDKQIVCNLAPRLIATVTQDVGLRYDDADTLQADLQVTLPRHLRTRFNHALKGDLIRGVVISRVPPGTLPPRSSC